MNNQTILLVLMVIVLASYILIPGFICMFNKPKKQSNNSVKVQQKQNSNNENKSNPNIAKPNVIKPNIVKPNVIKPNINTNTQSPKPKPKLNLIDEYLNETGCEENLNNSEKNIQENFNTAGPGMDMGNSMEFNVVKPMNEITKIDRALSNSLVPDFEPSYLNINPNINTYGYALNSDPEINYYAQRGFMNPEDAANYADTIQYDLAHPFETRYCEKL